MKMLAVGLAALAAIVDQDPPKKRDMKDRVWIEGKIVCIGCTLEKEFGAEPQCTLHAKHAQGLLDKDGRLWTIVDNTRGHAVITNAKLRDQAIKVFGWPYEKRGYVELWKYALRKGDDWVGWDYCKT